MSCRSEDPEQLPSPPKEKKVHSVPSILVPDDDTSHGQSPPVSREDEYVAANSICQTGDSRNASAYGCQAEQSMLKSLPSCDINSFNSQVKAASLCRTSIPWANMESAGSFTDDPSESSPSQDCADGPNNIACSKNRVEDVWDSENGMGFDAGDQFADDIDFDGVVSSMRPLNFETVLSSAEQFDDNEWERNFLLG
jgi:hypothetical protein